MVRQSYWPIEGLLTPTGTEPTSFRNSAPSVAGLQLHITTHGINVLYERQKRTFISVINFLWKNWILKLLCILSYFALSSIWFYTIPWHKKHSKGTCTPHRKIDGITIINTNINSYFYYYWYYQSNKEYIEPFYLYLSTWFVWSNISLIVISLQMNKLTVFKPLSTFLTVDS